MYNIEEEYKNACTRGSDIVEHMPTLVKYASECEFIVELGVRSVVSTWAFLKGNPKKLISVDIVHPNEYVGSSDINLVKECAKLNGTEFEFLLSSSLEISPYNCDLLFIDTIHTYDHLKKELALHGEACKKYIILHDTEACGYGGHGGDTVGLIPAINEFISSNKNFKIKDVFTNNNGLTILERV